ncbi:uncharacterized protein LOC132298948 isoform X2 [Cornus florida]|uniref:uncharacterized protein LOC132298948 isoform X2 n=1 Tax=Cornus florida TaxID=4283 RepID=UPI002899BA05|nr:uncharacterized protein LOC132298948 isoform X2 [Cornus florida]
MVLELDLNDPPPVEVGNPLSFDPNFGQAGEHGLSHIQVGSDSEPIDDELVICSPRSFAEARDRARRNRVVIEVLDEETEFRTSHSESAIRLSPRSNRRRITSSKIPNANGDLCTNLVVRA